MKTAFTIIGSIFGLISAALFNFAHTHLGLLFVALAILSYTVALFSYLNKNKKTKQEGRKNMNIIGKKVIVKIGGSPPKDDPNEIVGEKTVVHVPESEIGKYDKIVGVESSVIIGEDQKKDK